MRSAVNRVMRRFESGPVSQYTTEGSSDGQSNPLITDRSGVRCPLLGPVRPRLVYRLCTCFTRRQKGVRFPHRGPKYAAIDYWLGRCSFKAQERDRYSLAAPVRGCSSVWLGRSLREREVAGSNPVIPTIVRRCTQAACGLLWEQKVGSSILSISTTSIERLWSTRYF